MTGYILAGAIWMLTGILCWRLECKLHGYYSHFDAMMIGPSMICGPICLIAMLRSHR